MVGRFSDSPRPTEFDAGALVSGNLDNARLPAGGTDAAGWSWFYYAPGKKEYFQRFSATSPANQDQEVAGEAAVPTGVADFADLRIVGVAATFAATGTSRVQAAVRQGATATTLDVV